MVLFKEILGIKLLLQFFICFLRRRWPQGVGGALMVLFEEILGIKLLLQLLIVSLRR